MNNQLLLNYWNRLIGTGIYAHTPESEIKFIRFTNIVAVLTAVAVGVYIPHSIITGAYLLALLQTIDTFCVLLVLWLNKKEQYCFAKFTYMLVINAFVVINACFIGIKSGVHEFLFISNIVPFLLYRVNDYKGIISGIALSLSAFILFHYIYPAFTPYNLPEELQENVYRINIVMKFILFGVAMYILAAYNYRSEKELENINNQLHEKAEELQRSNQDLEQFAYTISHDLKAPVRNISSFLSLYMKKFPDAAPQGKEFLEQSKDSAIRLATLIDDLLSYSKVGKNLPAPSPTDLNLLLKTLQIELTQRLQETNGAVVIKRKLPVLSNVHSTMIYHVFQNLVTNGIKFNKNETPVVTIDYLATKTHHRFSVTDNGIGIPAEHRDKLFQMFRRLHTTEFEGTGMGLAICKKIVQHYNGQIWIESEAGKGTTFHFTIERVAANVKSEEAVTEEQDAKVFRLDTALLRTA